MLGGGGEGRGKAKISEGSPVFLATVRNPQSIRKVRGREWRSLAEWCAENHERSGKPENIPAGGDPLQMRFLRRGSLRGCTGLSPLERGCGGRQTCVPAPLGRRSAGVRGRTTLVCEAAAQYGSSVALLRWQRSFAHFIYSSQKLSKISLLASADDIFFPRSLKPVNPKTHVLLSFC